MQLRYGRFERNAWSRIWNDSILLLYVSFLALDCGVLEDGWARFRGKVGGSGTMGGGGDVPHFTQSSFISTVFRDCGKINFAGLQKVRIFALAFESESSKQEKHCDIVLTYRISPKFNAGGRSIYAFA